MASKHIRNIHKIPDLSWVQENYNTEILPVEKNKKLLIKTLAKFLGEDNSSLLMPFRDFMVKDRDLAIILAEDFAKNPKKSLLRQMKLEIYLAGTCDNARFLALNILHILQSHDGLKNPKDYIRTDGPFAKAAEFLAVPEPSAPSHQTVFLPQPDPYAPFSFEAGYPSVSMPSGDTHYGAPDPYGTAARAPGAPPHPAMFQPQFNPYAAAAPQPMILPGPASPGGTLPPHMAAASASAPMMTLSFPAGGPVTNTMRPTPAVPPFAPGVPRLLIWADDKPSNNKKIVDSLKSVTPPIRVVILSETYQIFDFFTKNYQNLLTYPSDGSWFRVITDRSRSTDPVRRETMTMQIGTMQNPKTPKTSVLTFLRDELQLKVPLLIYCWRVDLAQHLNRPKNHCWVTKKSPQARAFASFKTDGWF